MTGSFAGNIPQQSTLSPSDQPDHAMNIGEGHGPRKSSDPLWNNSKITYRAVTDLLDGEGMQHGLYDNSHAGGGDWGTFEAGVATWNLFARGLQSVRLF